MQKFDLHMHTTYCDGKDSAEAMVLSAIENGLAYAGISGHSFTPHDQSYCMSREGTQKDIEEVRGLKQKYAGSITLLLGTELDRYADIDLSPYDYYIGSVHYIFSEEGRNRRDAILERHAGGAARGAADEEIAASDAELETLVKYEDWSPVDDYAEDLCKFAFGGDGICDDPGLRKEKMLEVAELYFETVGGIVSATDCDMIGHFDLITKFTEGWGFGPAGNVISRTRCGSAEFASDLFDTSSERYIVAWKKAIDRIFEDCAERYKDGYRNRLENLGVLQADDKPVFEINTGAITKGYRTLPYPAADQIGYIKSKSGILILSSDSHAAGTICSGFEEFANLI